MKKRDRSPEPIDVLINGHLSLARRRERKRDVAVNHDGPFAHETDRKSNRIAHRTATQGDMEGQQGEALARTSQRITDQNDAAK